MSELVEDLFLLARLDEGRPLEREPVQLDEVAAEAAETARAVDPSRPIELDDRAERRLRRRVRLRQVWTTCSATRARTRRPVRRSASASGGRTARPCSRSPTRARA